MYLCQLYKVAYFLHLTLKGIVDIFHLQFIFILGYVVTLKFEFFHLGCWMVELGISSVQKWGLLCRFSSVSYNFLLGCTVQWEYGKQFLGSYSCYSCLLVRLSFSDFFPFFFVFFYFSIDWILALTLFSFNRICSSVSKFRLALLVIYMSTWAHWFWRRLLYITHCTTLWISARIVNIWFFVLHILSYVFLL